MTECGLEPIDDAADPSGTRHRERGRGMNNQGSDETFDYDISLSFAGEDRAYVEKVAGLLRRKGIRVFCGELTIAETLIWASNYVWQGELEDACRLGNDALVAIGPIRLERTRDYLRELHDGLAPHIACPWSPDFLEQARHLLPINR